MRKHKLVKTLSLGFVLAGLWTVSLCGEEVNSGSGTSAFPFLKINLGGRPVSMGGAFTGLADDEAALYYNPAGIADFEYDRFILGYHDYFLDMQSGLIGYIKSIDLDRSIAFHVDYLNYGDFIETNRAGDITGTFGGGDLLLAGSFAMQKTRKLSIGITAKFIYEKLQNFSATGLALDLGVKYRTDRGRYTAGLMLQNLGIQLSSLGEGGGEGLPMIVRAGGSAQPRGLPLLFAGDIIIPVDNDIDFAVGAELLNLEPLFLRMGWNSFGSNYRRVDADNGLAGMSFGIGLDYKSMQLSYAFTPAADLGESHRITLTGELR